MAAFLEQVGRREVDGDAPGRQRQAQRVERRAHPLARFADRLVGQADDGEGRQPEAIVTWVSTSSTSMPWNATVRTRATKMLLLCAPAPLYASLAAIATRAGHADMALPSARR